MALGVPKYLKGVGQLNFTSMDRVPGLTGGFSNHHNHSVQLIDAESGAHIWADRFDRDLTDIFAIQDELTQEIIAALKVKLTEIVGFLVDCVLPD
jgi:hypothetical protein